MALWNNWTKGYSYLPPDCFLRGEKTPYLQLSTFLPRALSVPPWGGCSSSLSFLM